MELSPPPLKRILAVALFGFCAAAGAQPIRPTWQPPVLSPAEEARTFQLPPGYHLELVLSEPEVRQPVLCVFDGEGRMYVAEMRSYMQDQNATGEFTPDSVISRHESTAHDGRYNRHTTFADHLLLPRMILPFQRNTILVGVTNTQDLSLFEDRGGTGRATTVELFYKGGSQNGNLEHQPSGLVWAMDNWIYTTYNAYRLRWRPHGAPLKEATAPNGGQWGIGQDDHGKLWFSNAGAEKPVVSLQTPVDYASIDLPDELDPDFDEVFPAIGLGDFQGGLLRVRQPEMTLNHFTACGGQEIYRGDRLPAELRGNLFIPEPVGRLIRRATIEVRDGMTIVSNPDEAAHTEFLRSTDPYFRPVSITNGPDGCLYIVDMYRGIIQEGNWVKPGSYLRPVVEEHKLQLNIGRGRIWRLVHDGMKPAPWPHLDDDSADQLVDHLNDANGWWRDTAQRFLILRQDRSVVERLRGMVNGRSPATALGRLHALWTLDGLDATDTSLLTPLLGDGTAGRNDPDPTMRSAALRASESLFRRGDTTLGPTILALFHDPDPQVALQAIMTAKRLNLGGWQAAATATVHGAPSVGERLIGADLLRPPDRFNKRGLSDAQIRDLRRGQDAYDSLCFACHGKDGRGAPAGAPGLTLAPALEGSRIVNGPKAGIIDVLLHGLTGPDGTRTFAAGQMISVADSDDGWISAVASFVRRGFGNEADVIKPAEVTALRAATHAHTQPWTREELAQAVLPPEIDQRPLWKITSGRDWVQVELPAPAAISGLDFDSVPPAELPHLLFVRLSPLDPVHAKSITRSEVKGTHEYLTFEPVTARILRIETEDWKGPKPLALQNIRLYGTPPGSAGKKDGPEAPPAQ